MSDNKKQLNMSKVTKEAIENSSKVLASALSPAESNASYQTAASKPPSQLSLGQGNTLSSCWASCCPSSMLHPFLEKHGAQIDKEVLETLMDWGNSMLRQRRPCATVDENLYWACKSALLTTKTLQFKSDKRLKDSLESLVNNSLTIMKTHQNMLNSYDSAVKTAQTSMNSTVKDLEGCIHDLQAAVKPPPPPLAAMAALKTKMSKSSTSGVVVCRIGPATMTCNTSAIPFKIQIGTGWDTRFRDEIKILVDYVRGWQKNEVQDLSGKDLTKILIELKGDPDLTTLAPSDFLKKL